MKFAKELEQDLVPEWRAKYLDYKAGKKKVKAVARAVNRANATPRTPGRPTPRAQHVSLYGATSPLVPRNKPLTFENGARIKSDVLLQSQSSLKGQKPDDNTGDSVRETAPIPFGQRHSHTIGPGPEIPYGSFIPTPPAVERQSFELPDPALASISPVVGSLAPSPAISRKSSIITKPRREHSITVPQNAYEVGATTSPTNRTNFGSLRNQTPQTPVDRPLLRRIFSAGTPLARAQSRSDVNMVVLDQVRAREQEFFSWMEKELEKVETFYKSKEDEAGARLQVLREQLHEMRNRRIQEVADAQQAKAARKDDARSGLGRFSRNPSRNPSREPSVERISSKDHARPWLDPFGRFVEHAKATAFGPRPGSNSRALQSMHPSPALLFKTQPDCTHPGNSNRDYVRRPRENEVSYRSAKRKLKAALQEHYRGMELLKSYAILNRTAFRKINKKYDKAVHAHPPLRFMTEKVNNSWFVQSDVLDGYIVAVEDLYSRYFERGNHKIAVGKLRNTTGKPADQSGRAFRNGVLIGIGAVFSIQGITYGTRLLFDPDPTVRFQTSYLLQIYGGIWTRNKINYKFVFEFDPRHDLDWRELTEFPAFLIFLFGLFLWVNFTRYGSPAMFIYYPIVLIFVTIVVIFMPAPILFHRSRKWFVYSHVSLLPPLLGALNDWILQWRLALAGLYPVEFRDFFLGDMYCSLTYLMSNIELFFCLYATHWHNPTTCNSTHSRLLGFFSAIPGIWRALQCIRRYHDTRNMFPHLVNCGKYGMTIVYYVTLSIYRIDQTHQNLIIFSTFAALNAIYCTIWDLLMDWSLLQQGAKKPLLRDVRGFKNTWWYYAAMVIDPIFRFNWIFYSIYITDLQHSSAASFFIGFSEVTRRGIWTLFRVENEHCSNVAHFKASRDVPLPYDLESGAEESRPTTSEADESSPVLERSRTAASTALSQQISQGSPKMRRRPARTFTRVLADAHMQDFEKKRKPNDLVGDSSKDNRVVEEDVDERASSDEDEDEEDVLDAQDLISGRASGVAEDQNERTNDSR
ncbi:EXS family protein [Rutstroemia sp. NJR-2017a BBW]|nr:EXS family protein [Rutstroemia sp. NJR-2017a BBW]